MLKELQNPRQNPNDPFRRVFFDDYFDIFVWYSPNGEIVGFQLCYDVQEKPRALTFRGGNYSHSGIDQGESNPLKNQSPMMMVDGKFAKSEVLRRFVSESAIIDQTVAQLVIDKLNRCPDTL